MFWLSNKEFSLNYFQHSHLSGALIMMKKKNNLSLSEL